MSILTKSFRYCMVIEAILANSSWYQAVYEPATVADSSLNFSLDFGSSYTFVAGHSLGDCLSAVKGQPFSTYDADHDGDVSTNCAQRHESGWWMGPVNGSGCTLCNPTGRLLQPADMKRTNQDTEVFWTPLGDGTVVPETVRMWVQRC